MAETLPRPVTSDLRFSARVDYFATPAEANAFAHTKRREGYNVHAPVGPIDYRSPSGRVYTGVHGVHWFDRRGEGWYS